MAQINNLGDHVDGTLITQSQSQKEVTANALLNLLSDATQKRLAVTISDGAGSPTEADTTLTDDQFFGNFVLDLGGTPSVAFDLTVPASGSHAFAVKNGSGQTATVTTGVGTTVALATGLTQQMHSDGTDIIALAASV